MKPHAEQVTGNLITSADDGSIWALWRMLGVPFQYASDTSRISHQTATARMIRALRGPALMFSVCEPVTETVFDEALREGAVPSPRLDERIEYTILSHVTGPDQTLYRRTFWLAVRLHGGRSDGTFAQASRAARGAWETALSSVLDKPRMSDVERAERMADQVADVESQLGLDARSDGSPEPGRLMCRRATPGDYEWLTMRLPRRGTEGDLARDDWLADAPAESGRRMMRLNDAGWAENYTETPARGMQRHVAACVDGADGKPVLSYQTSLVVASAPTDVWYPGGQSEWLVRAAHAYDQHGAFPVDWFVLLDRLDADKARKKVDRQLVNAGDQVKEQESGPTGLPDHVLTDVEALQALRDMVGQGEPLFETVTWFTITADSTRQMERRLSTFRGLWSVDSWDLPRPGKDQTEFVRASQPGAILPKQLVSDFSRLQTADLIACGAPFAGAEVGDPWGAFIGVNLGDGLGGHVLFDPGYAIRTLNRSGSVLFLGVTGAGKSQTKKTLAEALMVRGSKFVAVDPKGEYVPFAEAVGGQVVDPFAATVSIDPLAIFTALRDRSDWARERAANATIGMIDALTSRVETHSRAWADLRFLIDAALNDRKRLVDVVAWMNSDDDAGTGPRYPSLVDIAGPMMMVSRMPSMRSLFDGYLTPFNPTRSFTAIVLRGLRLPKVSTGVAAKASPEERQGLMLMTAAVHAATEAVYLDPGRYGAVILDESRALIQTEYGKTMVWDLLDKGRWVQAGAWISVTDQRVLPDEFAAQTDYRLVFRQTDDDAIRATAPLLDDAGQDPGIRSALRDLHDGQCFMRDARGRVGRVQILRPIVPEIAVAVNTTPTLNVEDDEPVTVGS